MHELFSTYQRLLNLQDASFTRIEHPEAMVATVYKIATPHGEQFILKISKRPSDYFREVKLLSLLSSTLPVPKIVDTIAPSQKIEGAILMECLKGSLLHVEKLTENLAMELGSTLAKVHLHRLSGYGDPLQEKLYTDPHSYLTLKFQEGLKECQPHLSSPLLKQCQAYYDAHLHLLKNVDGPCIVHRDFRPGNLMVHQGKLQGIIDWAGARASFTEEDFCSIEHDNWLHNPALKKSFSSGYAQIRPVPSYAHLLPFLRLNKAIATLGFLVKCGIWNRHSKLYQNNLEFLETLN